jgi:hypothetical protein
MNKKYKIILLQDSVSKKTLFKSNIKRNTLNKFRKLGNQKPPSFTRKYVKRKICQFELGLFSLSPSVETVYSKDELGRNVKRELRSGDYYLHSIIDYWVEEQIYDHQSKKRIGFINFIENNLTNKTFKQIFTLNNKVVIQDEEVFFIFSLKNIDDTNRFIFSLKNYLISMNRMDCLVVQDYDTVQRKQLYIMLEKNGFNRQFLYKHYTY